MSPSVHVDKKKKDISILDENPTQWLDNTTLTAEKKYPINFTSNINIFFLVCIIMNQTVIYLLMV